MAWHGSDASFNRAKKYLDAALNGQKEFFHNKPESFAKRLRGAIKNARERRLVGYEPLFNATVKVTAIGVEVSLEESSYFRKTRTEKFDSVYDILLTLGTPTPKTDYTFLGSRALNLDEVSMLENFCRNSNLVFVHYDITTKKVRICTDDRD